MANAENKRELCEQLTMQLFADWGGMDAKLNDHAKQAEQLTKDVATLVRRTSDIMVMHGHDGNQLMKGWNKSKLSQLREIKAAKEKSKSEQSNCASDASAAAADRMTAASPASDWCHIYGMYTCPTCHLLPPNVGAWPRELWERQHARAGSGLAEGYDDVATTHPVGSSGVA